MKIASFTMMRNESAILRPFLDQLAEFADHSVIVDHLSADGSVGIVRERADPRIELLHLNAGGYPQSQVATAMMHRIFSRSSADWLLFLDCDEFLPFDRRDELEEALKDHSEGGYCCLRWLNIVPVDLEGGNIFEGEFRHVGALSPFPKILLSRSFFDRHYDLQVLQGYHGCTSTQSLPPPAELSPRGLLHIPVTSRARFSAKVRSSGRQVMSDRVLVAKEMGYHWINHYIDLLTHPMEEYDFYSVGLAYPERRHVELATTTALSFKFPYVRSPYHETPMELMKTLYRDGNDTSMSDTYVIQDEDDNILTSHTAQGDSGAEAVTDGVPSRDLETPLQRLSAGETFSQLIEPLFSLPTKLPPTAWSGHIPFLMMLIKLCEPLTYVELGTHYGASLIAAATASKSFNVPMKLFAIDSWEGDQHAGVYEGEPIYRELSEYVARRFKNVELIRSYFDKALNRFSRGSIDILHIDGLHTYDAVKHDFLSWLPKMAPDGIILFHDTCVHERGFGVHNLWEELKERFVTLSFGHSFGLGVCFLDSFSPRVAALGRVARDRNLAELYTSLVAQIGGLVHPRMDYLLLQEFGRGSEQDAWNQVASLRSRLSDLETTAWAELAALRSEHSRVREQADELAFYKQQYLLMTKNL